ncbi:MAG TPA: serine/threonine-protein kinase [Trebonia sp.]|nr:serine/threonine-protein kinase [Trebonia sp.]
MPELPLVGTDFAGYRLRAVLGRGGMSIVYQAENPRLRNLIALKVLAPELANDQVFRTRFREESQIAASLNHPHVIPIHDFGSSAGLLYIAMRYVSGTDLRHLIANRGWLAPYESVHLLEQAARALDAAHRRGLVHRDVKPGNLLISRGSDDGDPDHMYLADFGITKYVGRRSGLTVAGTVLGTVHYVSPEQIQDLTVLGQADQYSLGCVLYECLTGRAPFEKSSNEAIMWAHVHDFAASPSLLRPGLPPAIDEVFARVLAKNPDDRYVDCRGFIAAARGALARGQTGTQDCRSPANGADPNGAAATVAFQQAPVPVPAGGQRGGGDRRTNGRRPERRSVRNVLSMLGVAALAAGGTATGLLVSQGGNSSIGIHQAAESSAPPSALFSVLDRTEEFTGMLRMSACVQKTATNVQCTNPDPAIASVTFATYPSLSALYTHYQEIAENLSHQHFAAVENTNVCGSVAPNPTGENTWNHSDQYYTKYSVAQLASGKMSTDTAMGRVFCVQKPDGSAVMVWTQNSGDLLGYATGGEASHEQVWNWFYDIHHNIIFPGQPAMTGMSMSGTASPSGIATTP